MKRIPGYIVIIMLLFIYSRSRGQELSQYNLNMSNGLPANLVYGVLKDRYGYLWIGTRRGVVKYNGYELKTFGLKDGMASDDVWKLFEDSKGRMWLGNVSHEIGYVYKDKYYKAFIDDPDPDMYPTYITETPKGNVVFVNNVVKDIRWKVYMEEHDTLRDKLPGKFTRAFAIPGAKVLLYNADSFYILDPSADPPILMPIHKNNYDYLIMHDKVFTMDFPLKNWLVSYYPNSDKVHLINTDNFHDTTWQLEPGEFMINGYYYPHNYLVSNKKIYRLNDNMQAEAIFAQNELVNDSSFTGPVSYMIEDSFWHRCIGTSSNGIYFHYEPSGFTSPKFHYLTGFKYVGKGHNGVPYFWNKQKRVIATLKAQQEISYQSCPDIYNINKISPYKSGLMVYTNWGIFFSEEKKISVKEPFIKARVFLAMHKGDTAYTPQPDINKYITDIEMPGDKIYVSVGAAGLGSIMLKNDTCLRYCLSDEKASNIVYDTYRKAIWSYNPQHISIYFEEPDKTIEIDYKLLNTAGIKKIEKIIADAKYGNIFIQDYDHLYCYDFHNHKLTKLFPNFRLGQAAPYISGDRLVIAGKFGALCCKIAGVNKFADISLYRNIKNQYYSYVNDVSVAGDQIVLNTDKGFYTIHLGLPATSGYNATDYKFIVTYNDSARIFLPGDSIAITQSDRKLQFDVINPYGNGPLKFIYRVQQADSTWKELDAKELYLNELHPAKYYTVSVIASDDVWQSSIQNIKIYIIPYWWQTTWGKRTIVVIVFILGLGIIFGVSYVTKRIVTKKHLKRNMQLSLELKSIYSQINPHFIFNTLNTGLYFIQENKMPEAYAHISSFSELLRSYIKSSRNKFVLLAEEIENLTNYIVLQQNRFEDKFDYEIILDQKIDADSVYIPALLLQPLVENAINHGLLNKEGKGHLKIEFKKGEANELICIIDDNGIGREKSKLLNEQDAEKTQSFGTELVKELIAIFNTHEMMDIQIDYFDKVKPDTGTTVTLTIKDFNNDRKI